MTSTDGPSAQLLSNLQDSITNTPSRLRPILHHLNADTSWLLSLPYTTSPSTPKNRAYCHILIDPWFQGPQSDVAAFFSRQWHAIPSAVQTGKELEKVAKKIEEAARPTDTAKTIKEIDDPGEDKKESYVDAIIISHEFTDHMHQKTLLSLPASIPVIASPKAASIIRSWTHFSSVADLSRFTGNWRESRIPQLPAWIGISRVAYPGRDLLYYHSAVLICFCDENESEEAEAVLYTPHGVSPANVEPLSHASPRIRILALLHGLQDIKLPRAQLNKGAHNGLKLQRILDAKYWVGTHDEVKKGGGIVSWFLNRKMITIKEAVEKEKEKFGDKLDEDLEGLRDVRFKEVDNGAELVLE